MGSGTIFRLSVFLGLIAVKNHGPRAVPAQDHGHREGVLDEVGAHVVGDSPTDDTATVGVDDRRQIDLPFPRPQIGNIADPNLVQSAGIPLPFHGIHRVAVSVVDDGGRLPSLRADPCQTQAFHGLGNCSSGDDLAVRTQVDEDPRGPVDLVGIAVEEGDFLLDVFLPDRRRLGCGVDPGAVARAGDFEEADHAGDGEVGLLRQHQFERLAFVSDASWAKKMDAFFKNACPSSSPRFPSAADAARRSRTPSPRPTGLVTALNAITQRPNVASLIPSSRATVATALPVVTTSFTASSLYSGVKSRRHLVIVNILSCEVSTQRGQGQFCTGTVQSFQEKFEAWWTSPRMLATDNFFL